MKLIGMALLMAATMMVTGCSQGTAAPMQNLPTRPVATASLAPRNDYVSDSPVRIPDSRKPAPVPPVTAKKEPAKVTAPSDSDDSEPVQAVSYEQERKQQGKGNNRRDNNGSYRTDGKQFSKQDLKRNDKTDAPSISKSKEDEAKVSADQNKVKSPDSTAVQVSTDAKQTKESAPSESSGQATPSSTEPVSPTSTSSSSSSASSTTFAVTYGSASQTASRNYKKPSMPSNLPSWFTENDKDGDGQLTMNEWPADKFAEFNKYDLNQDGIITIEEAMKTVPKVVAVTPPAATTTTGTASTTASGTAAPASSGTGTPAAPAPAKPVANVTVGTPTPGANPNATPMTDEEANRSVEMTFNFVDTNKDGVLDEKEIENSRRIKSIDWKKYDTNKDGKLDKKEVFALFKAEGRNMGGMGGGMGGAGRSPEEMAKTMFDNMDRAKTGKLTKEQFPGFLRDRFSEFDTNKDGFVDFEEFKANSSKMMPGRGGRGAGGDGGGGPGRGGRDGGGGRGFGGGNGGFGR